MGGCEGASIKDTGTDKLLLYQITTTQEEQTHHTTVVCLLISFVTQSLVCSSHTCTSACRLVAMVTTIICPGILVAGMFEVIHLYL